MDKGLRFVGAHVLKVHKRPRSSFPNATAIHSPLFSRCRHCNIRLGLVPCRREPVHPAVVSLAFLAAIGLAVVVAVSSRILGSGDARPVTLYMSAAASVLLLLLCAASGDLQFPKQGPGGSALAQPPCSTAWRKAFLFLSYGGRGAPRRASGRTTYCPAKLAMRRNGFVVPGREANF